MPDDDALAPLPDSDETLLRLWLHGRSPHTQRAYSADVADFRRRVAKPFAMVSLGDLQGWDGTLAHLAPSSRHRRLTAVKSLLAFGHRLGYLPFDVGRALRLPSRPNRLAERILEEPAVQRMLALETDARNHAILLTFYGSGMRVAELAGLRWRDVRERGHAGQVTIHGKGGKSRTVLLTKGVYRALLALGPGAGDDPVFVSRKGGHLDVSQVRRIVLAAARRAGIPEHVSPHFLRHAHASHALDAGCPISLVQATLGHSSVATTGKYLHARPTESSGRYLRV